jgi:hypothetical protein
MRVGAVHEITSQFTSLQQLQLFQEESPLDSHEIFKAEVNKTTASLP